MSKKFKFGDFSFISDKLTRESINEIFQKLDLKSNTRFSDKKKIIYEYITERMYISNLLEKKLMDDIEYIYITGWQPFIKLYYKKEYERHKLNIEKQYMSFTYLNALAIIQASYLKQIDVPGYCRYGYTDANEITAYYDNGTSKEFNRYTLSANDIHELKTLIKYADTYY